MTLARRLLPLFLPATAFIVGSQSSLDGPTAERTADATGLYIVVIDGEDAVNIVQQKTAVAPLVEIRDRNDQPVAGAVVRFAIRNGRATFGGTRNLTVVTNAAGRAAAVGHRGDVDHAVT
jgi:hypothetical protein